MKTFRACSSSMRPEAPWIKQSNITAASRFFSERHRVPGRAHPSSRIDMNFAKTKTIEAEPYAFDFDPATCALLLIDMQRDFLEPGGFGEMLGNDVSQLRRTIQPNKKLLAVWREMNLPVIHTREGHRPDLADLPPAKKVRGRSKMCIGDSGPMG